MKSNINKKKVDDGVVSSKLLRSFGAMVGALDFCFSY
jgi:hypothetical protein